MESFLGETIVDTCKKCQTTLQKIVDKQEGDYFYCPTCRNCQMQGTASEEFDFILVRQKDYILNLINNRRFSEARSCLTVLCELWTKHDYKYKYDELIQRIRSSPREVED